jgi:general secretion pathway protein D
MPPAREPIKVYGDAVTLNFEEAPLSEVVHSIVGDLLGSSTTLLSTRSRAQ